MKLAGLCLLVILTACSRPDGTAANQAVSQAIDPRAAEVGRIREPLTRFYKPMTVQPGDWLESHPEDGETFEEYLNSRPTLPTASRKTIYIQPIGKFSATQKKIIGLTADYMKAFFDQPVVLRKEQSLGNVPDGKSRSGFLNKRQIRTSYFIDDVLPKMLPNDAAALICFTNYDLYPEETWNYVFGQASLDRRVGVWSLWRLERDEARLASDELFLDRTLKVAMHETGHMFSMRHCKKYECLMSGTNHLEETDRRPLDTCPECTAKIVWAMEYPAVKRFEKLADFWRKQRRSDLQNEMLEKLRAVRAIK